MHSHNLLWLSETRQQVRRKRANLSDLFLFYKRPTRWRVWRVELVLPQFAQSDVVHLAHPDTPPRFKTYRTPRNVQHDCCGQNIKRRDAEEVGDLKRTKRSDA